ncbi:MAG TPA: DUF1893 domain-containing protein [Clostridiaceae bacterium]|jgi:hypothetical protein|nr:DUF1893 domain-containing protein [Clostridiaceae bacterium]
MDSLSEAKRRLEKPGVGFALISGDYVYESSARGIAPPMHCLSVEPDKMKGASVADKIVGRAVALLLIFGGVKFVHAQIISQHALDAFAQSSVVVTFEDMVPYVVNRQGDGMCPMEETVLGIQEPQEAYISLQKKIKEMQANPNS